MGLSTSLRPALIPLGLAVKWAGVEITGSILTFGLITAISGREKLKTAQSKIRFS